MLIGTDITDWSKVGGAYYAGAGSEGVWLILSVILCVLALIMGLRYERAAYRKVK
jgi:hypothetical protein